MKQSPVPVIGSRFMSTQLSLLSLWLSDCWRGIVKALRHLVTGKGEIERICSDGGYHSAQMTAQFASSLFYSRQLKPLSKTVFSLSMFSVSGSVDVIVTSKHLPMKSPQEQVVVANIGHCLHALKYFNVCAERVIDLKDTAFDASSVSHVNTLESFWSCMKPGVQRSASDHGGISSEDWSEVSYTSL